MIKRHLFSVTSLLIIGLVIAGLVVGCAPKELSMSQQAILNKPAVTIIYTWWSADVVAQDSQEAVLGLYE